MIDARRGVTAASVGSSTLVSVFWGLLLPVTALPLRQQDPTEHTWPSLSMDAPYAAYLLLACVCTAAKSVAATGRSMHNVMTQ